MDGWNTNFLLGWPMFRGYVSFWEGIIPISERLVFQPHFVRNVLAFKRKGYAGVASGSLSQLYHKNENLDLRAYE